MTNFVKYLSVMLQMSVWTKHPGPQCQYLDRMYIPMDKTPRATMSVSGQDIHPYGQNTPGHNVSIWTGHTSLWTKHPGPQCQYLDRTYIPMDKTPRAKMSISGQDIHPYGQNTPGHNVSIWTGHTSLWTKHPGPQCQYLDRTYIPVDKTSRAKIPQSEVDRVLQYDISVFVDMYVIYCLVLILKNPFTGFWIVGL